MRFLLRSTQEGQIEHHMIILLLSGGEAKVSHNCDLPSDSIGLASKSE